MACFQAPTYTLLTEDVVQDWRKSGHPPAGLRESLEAAAAAQSHPVLTVSASEVFWRVVTGFLEVPSAIDLLRSSLCGDSAALPSEVAQILCDVLWGIGVVLSRPEAKDDSDEWLALSSLVTGCSTGGQPASEGGGVAVGFPPLLSPDQLRGALEPDLLESAGLVSNASRLKQRAKKRITALKYRQQKYNLLSEESEGYAKLLVLLSEAHEAKELHANVWSLIGYFDLDPNRCLDIVLEALEEDLGNHALVSLISEFRHSSLAPLLGFKFSFYAQPDVRAALLRSSSKKTLAMLPSTRARAVVPKSLYRLAACLLALGHVQLHELIPYLTPSLADMASADGAASVAGLLGSASGDEKKHSSQNALTMSDALFGSGPAAAAVNSNRSSHTARDNSGTLAKGSAVSDLPPEMQFVGLLVAIIELRCWDQARALVAVMEDAGVQPVRHVSVRKALCALLHFLLGKVYDRVDPLQSKGHSFAQIHKVGGAGLRGQTMERGPREEGEMEMGVDGELEVGDDDDDDDCDDESLLISSEEYYIPQGIALPGALNPIDSLVLVSATLGPILAVLGPWLSEDVLLFTKLCRVARAARAEDPQGIRTLLSGHSLVSCLSLIACNPAASLELWEVFKDSPCEERFRIYESWYGPGLESAGLGVKHELLSLAEQHAASETRSILKRLSKETVRDSARKLSKLAASNPLVVLDQLLGRVEVYDNFISPVVESLKFMTPFALDVGSYLLIRRLASERSLLVRTGLSVSQWLASLATFTGSFYRSYPQADQVGLLRFVAAQLRAGGESTLFAVVLREVLDQAGGVEMLENVSAQQLEGRAGGDRLRSETASFGVVSKINKRAVSSLCSALESSGTSLSLLVFLAQQRKIGLASGGEPDSRLPPPPLKLLGSQYDTLHGVLMQLTDFISGCSGLIEQLPSLASLVGMQDGDFGIDLPVAMSISRPLLRESLLQERWEMLLPRRLGGPSAEFLHRWDPLSSGVLGCFPPQAVEVLGHPLLGIFWSLTLYDVYVPKGKYGEEIARVRRHQSGLERASESGAWSAADASTSHGSAPLTAKERRAESARCVTLIEALQRELVQQQEHIRNVRRHLTAMKSELVPSLVQGKCEEDVAHALIEHLVVPRLLMSAEDALFAAKFCDLIHTLRAPRFPAGTFLGSCLRRLPPMLFGCTEREALGMAFFLREALDTLRRWSTDSGVHKLEAEGTPGLQGVSHEQFILMAKTWTHQLTRTLVECLRSSEYLHVKCALIVLTVVVGTYPWLHSEGAALMSEMQRMCHKQADGSYLEPREDLRVKALSTLTVLKNELPGMLMGSGMTFADVEAAEQRKGANATSAAAESSSVPSSGTKRNGVLEVDEKYSSFSRKGQAEEDGSKSQSKPPSPLKQNGAPTVAIVARGGDSSTSDGLPGGQFPPESSISTSGGSSAQQKPKPNVGRRQEAAAAAASSSASSNEAHGDRRKRPRAGSGPSFSSQERVRGGADRGSVVPASRVVSSGKHTSLGLGRSAPPASSLPTAGSGSVPTKLPLRPHTADVEAQMRTKVMEAVKKSQASRDSSGPLPPPPSAPQPLPATQSLSQHSRVSDLAHETHSGHGKGTRDSRDRERDGRRGSRDRDRNTSFSGGSAGKVGRAQPPASGDKRPPPPVDKRGAQRLQVTQPSPKQHSVGDKRSRSGDSQPEFHAPKRGKIDIPAPASYSRGRSRSMGGGGADGGNQSLGRGGGAGGDGKGGNGGFGTLGQSKARGSERSGGHDRTGGTERGSTSEKGGGTERGPGGGRRNDDRRRGRDSSGGSGQRSRRRYS
jgi:hypothetical protein